jgi:NADH:ubiquinone reductase (non-electrogenic)
VTLVDAKTGAERELPFGACVWATGIAMHPLIKQLTEALPEGSQGHFRSVVTDEFFRVRGAERGTIYALGDAATVAQPAALGAADALFARGDADGDGRMSRDELRGVLAAAAEEFPHLAEHARFLDAKGGASRFGGIVAAAFASAGTGGGSPLATVDDDATLDRAEFATMLATIDAGLRALPATAQVAKQQGDYLAGLFRAADLRPEAVGTGGGAAASNGAAASAAAAAADPLADAPRFAYTHRGSLAYVGRDRAVMDVPLVGPVMGLLAGLAWRGFETFSQISLRNQLMVTGDWVRTKLFGRDTSRV